MNMTLPPQVRVALYAITAVTSPLMSWLVQQEYIDAQWLALYSAEVAVVAALAGFSVPGKQGGKHAAGAAPAAVDEFDAAPPIGQGKPLADPAVHDDEV